MEKECKHEYRNTLRRVLVDHAVFGKRQCDKCGAVIVLSRMSKILIIAYACFICSVFIVFWKHLGDSFLGFEGKEKIGVVVPTFLTIYIAGLYIILKKAKYVTYVSKK